MRLKFNPLFRKDISDSLIFVEEGFRTVSDASILFITAFDGILLLLFPFSFVSQCLQFLNESKA